MTVKGCGIASARKAETARLATGSYAYGYQGTGTGRERDAAPREGEQAAPWAPHRRASAAGEPYRGDCDHIGLRGSTARRAEQWSAMAVGNIAIRESNRIRRSSLADCRDAQPGGLACGEHRLRRIGCGRGRQHRRASCGCSLVVRRGSGAAGKERQSHGHHPRQGCVPRRGWRCGCSRAGLSWAGVRAAGSPRRSRQPRQVRPGRLGLVR